MEMGAVWAAEIVHLRVTAAGAVTVSAGSDSAALVDFVQGGFLAATWRYEDSKGRETDCVEE